MRFRAIGGLGSKKYFIFCRNRCCGFNTFYRISKFNLNVKIQLGLEDMSNLILWGIDFHVGNRGVIVGKFFIIFAYKIFYTDVESTKIVTKMQIMDWTTALNSTK